MGLNNRTALIFTKLTILSVLYIGSIRCLSTSELPQGSSRLTDGAVVSPPEYSVNAFGSASIAVGVDSLNATCVGVLTSRTQFTTRCNTTPLRVYVGSPFLPIFPIDNFTGQFLTVTGGPIVHPYTNLFSYPVTGIPPGCKAVVPLLYPSLPGALSPGNTTECLAFGYSGPTPFRLNTRPALITDRPTCQAASPSLFNAATRFCALVLSLNGGSAICSLDAFTVVMCRANAGPNVKSEEDRLRGLIWSKMCRPGSQVPICHLFCSLNPFCGTFGPPTPTTQLPLPIWYLTGILLNNVNGCGDPPTPVQFTFVPTVFQ